MKEMSVTSLEKTAHQMIVTASIGAVNAFVSRFCPMCDMKVNSHNSEELETCVKQFLAKEFNLSKVI